MPQDAAGYVALAILGLAALTILFLMLFFFTKRDKPVVRKSSYVFLELMLLGTLLIAAAVIIDLFKTTSATCIISAWLFIIGGFLLFG